MTRQLYCSYYIYTVIFCMYVLCKADVADTDAKYKKLAQSVLTTVPFSHNAPFLIERIEWQELALAEYVARYDTTITAFGSWGFTKLTEPIADMRQIMQRQQTLVHLDTNHLLALQVHTILHELAEDQHAILSYFDTHDKLIATAQHLYYPSWLASKIPVLNSSKIALDFSYIHTIAAAVKSLAGVICMHGFAGEFMASMSEERPFKLANIFTRIVHEHSFNHKLYDLLSDDPAYDLMMVGPRIFWSGSFGDKWYYACNVVQSTLRFCFLDYVLPEGLFNGFSKLCAGALAVVERGYFDYEYVTNIAQQYRRLRDLHHTHAALQKRMVHIARFMHNMQRLIHYWQQLPYFAMHPLCKKLAQEFADKEHPLHRMSEQLQTTTFDGAKNIWYSRGDVLLAHKQLVATKEHMVPLLQGLALTDGFMSIVQLYSSHKNNPDDTWCLASFVEADKPILNIHEGKLPLFIKGVANNCMLGNALSNGHMLITGPSGAGKSSYLKMIGGAVASAHSWTIVPAHALQLTPYAQMRTCFEPLEDIKKGISTFMAQQQRLELLAAQAQASNATAYTLLLVDEPYRGTIEAEAEKRAYQFGKTVSDNPYTMVIMACHLQEPILLEQHTGTWCNRQVIIEQLSAHAFNCTYKIGDGPAWWWFNDLAQRMHFIDWLLIK